MVDRALLREKIRLLAEYIADLEEQQHVSLAELKSNKFHDYARVDPEILFGILRKNIGDLRLFARVIKERFVLSDAGDRA